jgi:hypothetical protein
MMCKKCKEIKNIDSELVTICPRIVYHLLARLSEKLLSATMELDNNNYERAKEKVKEVLQDIYDANDNYNGTKDSNKKLMEV